MYDVKFDADYTSAMTQLKTVIDRLYACDTIPPLSERKVTVDRIIDAFVDSVGRRPDGVMVRRLSDYLLLDVIADQYKRSKHYEYPFQTTRQVRRRQSRELAILDAEPTPTCGY